LKDEIQASIVPTARKFGLALSAWSSLAARTTRSAAAKAPTTAETARRASEATASESAGSSGSADSTRRESTLPESAPAKATCSAKSSPSSPESTSAAESSRAAGSPRLSTGSSLSTGSTLPLTGIRELVLRDLAVAVGVELLEHRHDCVDLFGGDHSVAIRVKDGHQGISTLATSAAWSTSPSSESAGSSAATRSAPTGCPSLAGGAFARCGNRDRHQQAQTNSQNPRGICKVSLHLMFLVFEIATAPGSLRGDPLVTQALAALLQAGREECQSSVNFLAARTISVPNHRLSWL